MKRMQERTAAKVGLGVAAMILGLVVIRIATGSAPPSREAKHENPLDVLADFQEELRREHARDMREMELYYTLGGFR